MAEPGTDAETQVNVDGTEETKERKRNGNGTPKNLIRSFILMHLSLNACFIDSLRMYARI